jgi:citronellol/citronellal dehydrogenase
MVSLKGKTLFITGASRGIGLAIGLRAAADGARVAIAAKTVAPHPKLPGTIYTAAEEIEAAGGTALPIQCDIRFEDQIADAMAQTVDRFGGIDVLVNNASAISLTGTAETPMKRFDLMHQINARGTFACCQTAYPFLRKAENPHILTISPPLDMTPRWFAPHVAYTMAKFGMSMCMLGMAEEFAPDGIACNCLWPRTAIATAALQVIGGMDATHARRPEIVADAAHVILTRDSRACTGHFFIDDEVLAEEGITDFAHYAVDPNADLAMDFFVPGAEPLSS